jgi:hypothetical protein
MFCNFPEFATRQRPPHLTRETKKRKQLLREIAKLYFWIYFVEKKKSKKCTKSVVHVFNIGTDWKNSILFSTGSDNNNAAFSGADLVHEPIVVHNISSCVVINSDFGFFSRTSTFFR